MKSANDILSKCLEATRQRAKARSANVVDIDDARKTVAVTGYRLIDEARRRSLEEAARDRRATLQRWLQGQCEAAGIQARHAGANFEGYEAASEPQRKALETCRRFGQNFARVRETGGNLLLLGSPGTGKTHLAAAILRTVLESGATGVFVTEAELLRKLRSTYQPGADTGERDAIAAFCTPDLLTVDEVGVGIGNPDTRRAMLFDILNGRYEARRPTLLVSNMTEGELRRHIGERAWDRLADDDSALVLFDWPSWRQRRRGAR